MSAHLHDDPVPETAPEAYLFLNRARSHWLDRVREIGVSDGSVYDTLRILQGAMTSVMIGADHKIY